MGVGIGLIGAGRMGKVFAHTLAFNVPEADFIAVSDLSESTVQEVVKRYGAKAGYSNYLELLERDDIQAVVIATPTRSHVEVVKAAAAADKHIFCEKPLAMTLEGCDDAIQAARLADVRLQVGFMRRYDPAYLMAKQQIEAGVIGTPVMFKSTGRDPRCPSLEFARRQSSGGLILDMGIHDFDAARWLMSSEVERVYSEGGCLVFPQLSEVGDIDNAVVNLKFANGAIGNVDVSRNALYGYDIRSEVLGSEGGLLIGRLQYTATLVLTRNGVTHDTVPFFMERFGEAYAAEIADFVNCIQEDREPSVSGMDARAATAIGIAATISLDEERPVWVSEAG
jgi:scyllo-inositol 2-dehydrogenase (NAD+)